MYVFKPIAIVFIAAALVTPVLPLNLSPTAVLIESLESKTIDDNPVYNKISLASSSTKDTWTMFQSHSGNSAHAADWDELRIVVDKTQRPYRASFLQLKDGKETAYRVSCFMCHANGPRAIRPNWKSDQTEGGLKNRLLVFAWNLKIKHYGTIVTPEALIPSQTRTVPLAFSGQLDNDVLTVKTCLICHQEKADAHRFKRAPIKRQHAAAINFLVETGQMPPFPFSLSPEERSQISRFVEGS